MAKRKALSKRTRFEVFKRDSFKCAYCGRTPPDVLLHVDHVTAVANGGSDDPTNLITACADCNLGKAAVPLTVVAESLERQAEEAQERAEQIRAYAEAMRAARDAQEDTVGIFAEAWFERFDPNSDIGWSWPADRVHSIKRFVALLPFPEILDAIEITAAAAVRKRDLAVKVGKTDRGSYLSDGNAFRYFCGVCWKKIRDREEGAA